MATFVYKVLQLAIRTASKPLASRFQSYVLEHPTLRPRVLKFGQWVHGLEFAMTRFSEGKSLTGARKFIATLDDNVALDKAGAFVSEGFVLGVGVGVIYWDYRRGVKKDAEKAVKDTDYKKATEERFLALEKEQRDIAAQQQAMQVFLCAMKEQQEQVEALLRRQFPDSKAQGTSWWKVF